MKALNLPRVLAHTRGVD